MILRQVSSRETVPLKELCLLCSLYNTLSANKLDVHTASSRETVPLKELCLLCSLFNTLSANKLDSICLTLV